MQKAERGKRVHRYKPSLRPKGVLDAYNRLIASYGPTGFDLIKIHVDVFTKILVQ